MSGFEPIARLTALQRPPLPWWSSPAGICLGFLLPVMFVIALVGDANLPGLTIRGARFLDGSYIAMGALLLAVIALAGWIGQQFDPDAKANARPPAEMVHWDTAACVIGIIAAAAYIYWLKSYLLNPMLIVQTLLGTYRPDRSDPALALTAGVTSLNNFAPPFFSVYAFRVAFPGPRISRAMHIVCAILLPLTVFRVYAWSERLALIETAVPIALAMGAAAAGSSRRAVRALVWLGPFIAMPMLILYFGLAESVRSWASDTYNGKIEFWDFAIGRLASYYYTSLNNGAGLLATMDWPTWRFEHTLVWLHKAPFGIGPWFTTWLGAGDLSQVGQFLTQFVDIEFNNPSGLYAVVCDLGLPLGIAYLALLSGAGGMLFRAYGAGHFIGVLVYPMLFLSFLEIFRYPYLGQPRAFTWTLGIVLALAVARFAARPASVFVEHEPLDADPALAQHTHHPAHG